MKKTLIDTYRSLTYNFKTLIYFELIYRVLGLLVIFPIAQLLFNLSIRLSGYTYITNQLLFEYLLKPTTIIILILLLIFLSIYVVVEMIFLSLIYDFGYHEKDILFKDFLILGLKKVYEVVKKYRLRIIGPAFVFFMIIELFHIVGIASTINLPQELINEIQKDLWLQVIFYVSVVCVIFLFIETAYSINLYTIENISTKQAFQDSRVMLKKQRLKMAFSFIAINVILNGILYFFYAFLILMIGFIVSLIKGQVYALSLVLTILYSLYLLIGFISTITLIPINYAMLTSFYYESREKMGKLPTSIPKKKKKTDKIINTKFLKRGVIVASIVILGINLSSVLTVVARPRAQLELFNYAEIIAHRGASWDAPENTLSAIELAIFQGADAVEIDIRETSDGIPILMHDTTLGRTTNDPFNRRVSHTSLADIKTLDAGSWFSDDFIGEEVPTLEEALSIMKGRTKVFLEFKSYSVTLEQSVIDLIDQYNMENDIVFLTFSRDQIRRLKALNPNIKTLLLISTFYGDVDALVGARDIDYFGLSEFFFQRNPEFIDKVHQRGKKVYVWTVNSERSISDVVEKDADGIITDRPLVAREIVYSKNTPDILVDILRRLFNTRN